MFKFIRVKGSSLRPEVQDGDIVLILTWRRLWRLQPGDRVVFRQPVYGTLIKKIERLGPGPDQVFVVGIHAASVDSYEFGPVLLSDIVGKVVFTARRKA